MDRLHLVQEHINQTTIQRRCNYGIPWDPSRLTKIAMPRKVDNFQGLVIMIPLTSTIPKLNTMVILNLERVWGRESTTTSSPNLYQVHLPTNRRLMQYRDHHPNTLLALRNNDLIRPKLLHQFQGQETMKSLNLLEMSPLERLFIKSWILALKDRELAMSQVLAPMQTCTKVERNQSHHGN